MASNFKVIFREEEGSPEGSPKYEPGCPLLIAAVQISRNTETGNSFLQIRTTNVSNSLAEEVRALATVAYPDGSGEEIPLGGFDADVKPGADHVFAAAKLSRSDAERADVRITLVKGAGEAWESKEDPVEVPLAEELELSDEVRKLRLARLAEKGCTKAAQAVRKAVDHGAYWSCTCVRGHVNAGERCIKCGLSKQDALDANDAGIFEKEIEEKKNLEKQKKQKRIKNLKSAALAVAIIAMLLFAATRIQHCAATTTDGSGTGAYVVTKAEGYSSNGTLKYLWTYDRGKHGDILTRSLNDYSLGHTETGIVSYTYNDYGTPATAKFKYDEGELGIVPSILLNLMKFTYKTTSTDEHGQPTSVSSTSYYMDAGTIDFKWHSEGHLEKYTHKDPSGNTEIGHYNESGEMTSKQVDSTTYEYEYKYDKQGRIISKIATGSDGSKETTRYEYDEDDNIVKVTYNDGSYEIREYSYIDNVSPAIAASSNHFEGLDFYGTEW